MSFSFFIFDSHKKKHKMLVNLVFGIDTDIDTLRTKQYKTNEILSNFL